MMKRIVLLLLFLTGGMTAGYAQIVAIKTNLLYGIGTLTPNLGAEVGLGKRTTLDFTGSYNPWNRRGLRDNNQKLVHYLLRPEFRYWTCERFNGHFFGVHAFFSEYNIAGHHIPLLFSSAYRYEGNAIGGGISYGYHWMWARRWGAEFTVGVGVAYLKYDKFLCPRCGEKVGNFDKTYFGPTRAGITLVYLIR